MVDTNITHSAIEEYRRKVDEIKSKYFTITKIATEEDVLLYRDIDDFDIKVGEKITVGIYELALPETPEACIKLLQDYFGQIRLAMEIRDLKLLYGDDNDIEGIKTALKNLEDFREEAEKINYDDACGYNNIHSDKRNHSIETIKMYEYKRLRHQFYKNNRIQFGEILNDYAHDLVLITDNVRYISYVYKGRNRYMLINEINGEKEADKTERITPVSENLILAEVYGRYFLFYDYLKNKLNELEQPLYNHSNDNISEPDIKKQVKDLTLKDMFILLTDYIDVIRQLKNREYIDDRNGIIVWIGDKKGKKSYIHGLLEHLCKMKYLEVGSLTPEQKVAIFKNTFNERTTINTIEKGLDYNKYVLKFAFIPAKK